MNSARGFSLVELLVAVLLLGVGMVGLVEGMNTALRSSKEAERQSAAALLAQGQIELIRADGYVVEGDDDGEFDPPMDAYAWKQSVVETTPEGLFEVTVTITDAASGDDIFELKTMLFDPPLVTNSEREEKQRQRRGVL